MDISSYTEWTSVPPKYETFGENFLWAYSCLQMLGATIYMKEDKFTPKSYMVRAKAFKAYKEGKWKIGDMYEINRMKVRTNDTCWYCRSKVSSKELTADHVFPRVVGGTNNMENIIYVCKTCNSSKGKKDLMEWLISQDYVPEYLVLEQYLKEIYSYSMENGLMSLNWNDIGNVALPFNLQSILLFQNSTFLKEVLRRTL